MIIGEGKLQGHENHTVEGEFILEKRGGAVVLALDEFHYVGPPGPGLAFSTSGPGDEAQAKKNLIHRFPGKSEDGAPIAFIDAPDTPLPHTVSATDITSIFLWCYERKLLLGTGRVVHRGAGV
ncbi:MAG: hypothetical protein AAGK38_08475 [Pseudomonadota bacterium]